MRNYKKEDFSKGQTVFIYVVGNAARYFDILPRLKTWDSLDYSQDHLARRLGYSCGFQGFAL